MFVHGDYNAELVEIERQIADWLKKHPGQRLPLPMQRKLDAVAKRYAEFLKGKDR